MDAIKSMTIGEVVDYCLDYNARMEKADREEKRGHKRKGNQNDIDTFFG